MSQKSIRDMINELDRIEREVSPTNTARLPELNQSNITPEKRARFQKTQDLIDWIYSDNGI